MHFYFGEGRFREVRGLWVVEMSIHLTAPIHRARKRKGGQQTRIITSRVQLHHHHHHHPLPLPLPPPPGPPHPYTRPFPLPTPCPPSSSHANPPSREQRHDLPPGPPTQRSRRPRSSVGTRTFAARSEAAEDAVGDLGARQDGGERGGGGEEEGWCWCWWSWGRGVACCGL